MYEQRFGLNNPLFPAKPVGDDVFVGPQTAKTLAGFRKALTAQEAVVTVSGPVGTGKTTLVERSVNAMGLKYKTIRVGRMAMDSSDVLEALLVVLGVQNRPTGTIQRFATLRGTLRELEDRNVRVFILIEDALRSGPETLAELEALTAADAGESSGANIVIMGDERLPDFMKSPQLAQLQQRVRRRHTILPFCAAETRGYLAHRFRRAGGEFDETFDAKSAELLCELSGGIPRIVNNLVESVLAAAAAEGIDNISASFIANVADDEYGLALDDFDFSIAAVPSPVAEVPEVPLPVAEPAPIEVKADEPLVEPAPVEEQNEVPVPADDDVPHLIQDTLPNLEILSPELASFATGADEEMQEFVAEPPPESVAEDIPELEPLQDLQAELEPEPEPETDAPLPPVTEVNIELEPLPETDFEAMDEDIPRLEVEDIPKLELEFDAEPEIAPSADAVPETNSTPELIADTDDEVPECDRDPTLAELKPDLDALEKAMALAHGEILVDAPGAEEVTEDVSVAASASDAIPEITLDKSIETGIDNSLDNDVDDVEPSKPAKQSDAELGKIAAELANAKSLDDIDDKMAETLFGTEISMICAQITTDMPKEDSANDAMQLGLEEPVPIAVGSEEPSQSPVVSAITEEVSLETVTPAITNGIDPSASQRLRTVRALNTELHPSLREAATLTPSSPAADSTPESAPVSIEDQINTSITQTVKALEIPEDMPEQEPEEKKKGFFSRFRR